MLLALQSYGLHFIQFPQRRQLEVIIVYECRLLDVSSPVR